MIKQSEYIEYIKLNSQNTECIYAMKCQNIKNIFTFIIVSNNKFNLDNWLNYIVFIYDEEIKNKLNKYNLKKSNIITIFKLLGIDVNTRLNNIDDNKIPLITLRKHKDYKKKNININLGCRLLYYILDELSNPCGYFKYNYPHIKCNNSNQINSNIITSKNE